MLLKDLIQDFKFEIFGAKLGTEIEHVTADPENHAEKSLYILLKPKNDIKKLPASGGIAILQNRPDEKISIPYIVCPDIRRAMAYIYSRFYEIDYKRLSFIGITGTNGKSSTLTILARILECDGHNVGCVKTGEISINGKVITDENYSMTTPDPSLLYKSIKEMQDAGCDTVVMEVSSHSLALGKLCPIFFDYGVFTGLSPEHLDFHSDMEEYYQTKKRLFDVTRCAVINMDDEYGKRLYSEIGIKKIGFGVIGDADAYIDSYEDLGLSGSRFKFRLSKKQINLTLPLVGCYNIYNALGAICVCSDMEISPYVIRDGVRNTEIVEGRFQILSISPTVIVDYAHTECAFECFLHELRKTCKDKQITVIFGCGGDRDKGKREKIGAAAERYADKIILTNDNPRSEDPMDIIRDILRGVKSKPTYIDTDRARVVKNTVISAETDEVIAIVGKGVEKYFIDGSGYHKYDEMRLIRDALSKRGKKNENKA